MYLTALLFGAYHATARNFDTPSYWTLTVERLEDEADVMPDGLSADQNEIRADQLTREMTEAFVEKVIVWPGQKLEIKWKIRK